MKVDRSLRAARAAVFAAVCVGVSAAGHALMSGCPIPAWALVAGVLLAGGAGYVLGGRQRGFGTIAGLMLAGELGLHLLFAAAQDMRGEAASPTPAMPGMAGMAGTGPMPGMVMPHAVSASAWLCGPAAAGASGGHDAMPRMPIHGSAGMITAHVAAGLLCAWWLCRGEAATFRLLQSLAIFAAPLLVIVWPEAPVIPDLTARVPDDSDEHAPTGRGLLVHAVVRRGPPAPVFSM